MELSTPPPRGFRFGIFEADLRASELRKNGLRLKLQEQPFQVLTMLLERPGEVVTRDELRKRLWDGHTFVDFDHGLNNAINKIRESLGDSAENPRFVETLPKRGYRFLAPVMALDSSKPAADAAPAAPPEEVARTEPARQKSAAWRYTVAPLGAVAALVALVVGFNPGGLRDRLLGISPLPQIQSIAVLPLENLSGDPEQEYFADGMTDALITELGQASTLRVISRTSIIPYKGAKKPLPEIARELNVDAIVEGTVLRSGDRVRITAQLLHAPTDRHLWAKTYEEDFRDILTLQRTVALAMINEMRIEMQPKLQARWRSNQAVNPEAYRLYLKGRYLWNKRTESDAKIAMQYFEQALAKQPGYALAYAGIADYYQFLGDYGVLHPHEAYPKAISAAKKALELDDTLSEAHSTLGINKLWYERDWAGAENEFKRALELNPSNAEANRRYGLFLTVSGRFSEAAAQTRCIEELDPLSYSTGVFLGWNSYVTRQYDRAIEQFREVIRLDPNFWIAHHRLGWAYEAKGMYKEAIGEFQKALELSQGLILTMGSLGHAYALNGQRKEALDLLRKLREQSAKRYVDPVAVAEIYLSLGEKDEAFRWLEKAYDDRSCWLVWYRLTPQMDPVRSDPRFKQLMRRVNFPA